MQDNIISGGPLGPRVTAVSPMEDYMLHLVFTNGEERIFDAKPLLPIAAFVSLQNKQIFEAVKTAYGSILWPSDIEYCPDTLYTESMTLQEWDPDWVKLTPVEAQALDEARAECERGETVRLEDLGIE